MTHYITKQPKWVRELLDEKDKKLERTNDELRRLQVAHAVLVEQEEWFTIPNPIESKGPEFLTLFSLHANGAAPVCSLGRGDTLLVGRAKPKVVDGNQNEPQG